MKRIGVPYLVCLYPDFCTGNRPIEYSDTVNQIHLANMSFGHPLCLPYVSANTTGEFQSAEVCALQDRGGVEKVEMGHICCVLGNFFYVAPNVVLRSAVVAP